MHNSFILQQYIDIDIQVSHELRSLYMFRSFTVLHCSHQHCVQPVASGVKVVGYL